MYENWKLDGWSYYYHDEEAMTRLLRIPEVDNEFPGIRQIVRNCLEGDDDSTAPTTKTFLWQLVVLYMYGGIYVDNYSLTTKKKHNFDNYGDSALFVLDQSTNTRIDHNFMVVPPRHPIMFYAIHHAILDIMETSTISSPDSCIEKALLDFQDHDDYDAADPQHSITSSFHKETTTVTTLYGTNNHTVTILGSTVSEKEIIQFMKNTKNKRSSYHHPPATDHCKNKILLDINDALQNLMN